MRTFTNHLRKSAEGEKTLNRVAEKVVRRFALDYRPIRRGTDSMNPQAASLPIFLSANPTASLPLLKALVAPPHGSPAFDHRTVEKVVAKLDLKGVRGWVKYLRELALGEDKTIEDGAEPTESVEDDKSIAARRLWAFDQLLHVIKAGNIPKDDELVAGQLEFFAVLGWFEVRKSGKGAVCPPHQPPTRESYPDLIFQQRSYVPVPAFTEALQVAARSRFFSVLTALPIAPSTSGQTWLSRALALLDNLSADAKHFTSIAETDSEVLEARAEVKEIYGKLAGVGDERKQTARSLIEGVLLLSYDEAEEASEALDVRFSFSELATLRDLPLTRLFHSSRDSRTASRSSSPPSSRRLPRVTMTRRWTTRARSLSPQPSLPTSSSNSSIAHLPS